MGGKINTFITLCEDARMEAYNSMVRMKTHKQARVIGHYTTPRILYIINFVWSAVCSLWQLAEHSKPFCRTLVAYVAILSCLLPRQVEHAAAMGANAIIGMAYGTTDLEPGITEVLCYGTAVVLVPTS